MRELSTCDFCGEEADGVYEVLPDDIGHVTAPRRLALCENCQGLLSSVLEPVLDLLREDGEGGGGPGATVAPSSARESGSTSDRESLSSPGPVAEPETGQATEPDAERAEADSMQSPVESEAEGVQIEPPEGDIDNSESTDESGSGGDSDPAADADSSRPESDNSDSLSPSSKPAGYGKLMRLLQNREGSMPREALHALATNAYDMSDETFEEIVEAAVENGDIEETDKGLKA